LKMLIKFAIAHKVKAIFVEPQFDSSSAKVIADEIGAEVVPINPLPENFLNNLLDVIRKLKQYLK